MRLLDFEDVNSGALRSRERIEHVRPNPRM